MMLFECDLGIASHSIRVGCERLQESLDLYAHALVPAHELHTPPLIDASPHLHNPCRSRTFQTSIPLP